LTAKNKVKGGLFILWAVSLNYKVVYDKGTTSVCEQTLGQGRVVKPTLQRADVCEGGTLLKQLRAQGQ